MGWVNRYRLRVCEPAVCSDTRYHDFSIPIATANGYRTTFGKVAGQGDTKQYMDEKSYWASQYISIDCTARYCLFNTYRYTHHIAYCYPDIYRCTIPDISWQYILIVNTFMICSIRIDAQYIRARQLHIFIKLKKRQL